MVSAGEALRGLTASVEAPRCHLARFAARSFQVTGTVVSPTRRRGVANALAAIFLLAANRPAVYLAGTAFYLATEGLCAARSGALIVEIVGPEARDASTLYSLLNAAVSLPIVYVTWLDGVGFHYFGTHGLLLTDAGLNFFVFGIVAVVFITCGLGLRSGSQTSAAESDLTSA
jgi:hypothetical protein